MKAPLRPESATVLRKISLRRSGLGVHLTAMLFAFAVGVIATVSAQTRDNRAPQLMNQIAMHCEEMVDLKFPRPLIDLDREVQNFNNRVRWLERDLKELRQLNPAAIDSPALVRGKPFNARVQAALLIVDRNRSALEANKIDASASQLMRQIAYSCKEIKELDFPRPETNYDSAVKDFEFKAQWLEKAIKNLSSLMPAAIESPTPVHNKPFNEQVKAALAIIERNRKGLIADRAAKPNPDALSEVDMAIKFAKNGMKVGAGFDELEQYYKLYSESLNNGRKDPRALEARSSELAEVEETFVTKYLAAKESHETQRAVAAAKEKERRTEEAKQHSDFLKKREAQAKALGYKKAFDGIVDMVEMLRDGTLSLAEAKTCLIHLVEDDDLQVQSIVGSYVVYVYSRRSSRGPPEIIQIAVLREKDRFYGDGAKLNGDKYAIVGTQKLTTVLGAQKEILVLKPVN